MPLILEVYEPSKIEDIDPWLITEDNGYYFDGTQNLEAYNDGELTVDSFINPEKVQELTYLYVHNTGDDYGNFEQMGINSINLNFQKWDLV